MNRRRNIIVATLTLAAIGIFALAAQSGPKDASKAAAPPASKAAPAPKGGAPVDTAAEKARLALPVAKIDDVEITLEYLETALDRQSPLLRKELADAAKRKDFIDKIINMEILAAEAERRGFSSDPEVASVRKNQLASLMHRKIADETPEVAPTDDAMRKYYDAHADMTALTTRQITDYTALASTQHLEWAGDGHS